MPFVEDPAEFLDAADFATSAIIGSSVVLGIFDRQYVDTVTIEGVHPTFLAETAKLMAAGGGTWGHGKILNIASVLYLVRAVEPDPTGTMTLSILEKNV